MFFISQTGTGIMVTSIKYIFINLAVLFNMVFQSNSSSIQIQTVVSMTGKVTEIVSKKPASVLISFYDKNNKKIGSSRSNSKTGYYLVTGLRPGNGYTIRIESIDYMKEEYDVIIPVVDEHITLTKDFEVIPKNR